MSNIQLKTISKSFGLTHVLKDVSLDIADGEFLVLVGPSGCGKSTLLRMISGLDQVSHGEIWIGEKDVTDLPSKLRDIAMVFQSYALYPHMTVAENMAFSLKLRGEKKQITDERVKRAAMILNLTQFLDRKPAALSGGQRQRVAMGRAMVRDPAVFLFDEPLSNLDAKLRVAMRSEIKSLHNRLKTTTVYVTHDQVEAMTMADRIVVMRDGIIEQVGTPLELYDHPANVFVAEFIGSPAMNILPGSIRKEVRGRSVALDCGAEMPMAANAAGDDGQPVFVGIRPEHFERGSGIGAISAVVSIVEPLGSQVQIGATAGAQSLTVVFNERFMPELGAVVDLMPVVQHIHVFDRVSGLRLNG